MSTQIIDTIIKRYRRENQFSTSDDFYSYFALEQVFKKYDLEFQDIKDSIIEGGGDGGIDSILITVDGQVVKTMKELEDLYNDNFITNTTVLNIILTQIKSSKFKESVWEKILSTFKFLYEDNGVEYDFNESTKEKLELVKNSIDKVIEFSNLIFLKICYVSKSDTSTISLGVKAKEKQTTEEIIRLTKLKNVEAMYYGGDILREHFNTPAENFTIIKYEKWMEKGFVNDEDSSYVVLSNLTDYYNIISLEGELRESFFEQNVRHFEGNVTVNREITDTLKNNKEVEFWTLNNGITILADTIVPISGNRLKIKSLQIVNGLQTSFCIYNYYKNDPEELKNEKRSILIKIIKVTDENVSNQIIKCTNNQTNIKAVSLRSTDPYQRDIESSFIANGYYYNRRKNYYKNQGKPIAKIFNVTHVAQVVEAILYGSPGSARNSPTKLLKADKDYNKIFNKENDISIYLKCCLIFEKTYNILKNNKNIVKEFKDQFNSGIDIVKFHLAYIVALKLTNNNVDQSKLLNMNIDDITDDICIGSFKKLVNAIKRESKSNMSVIDLSKSTSFDKTIKLVCAKDL